MSELLTSAELATRQPETAPPAPQPSIESWEPSEQEVQDAMRETGNLNRDGVVKMLKEQWRDRRARLELAIPGAVTREIEARAAAIAAAEYAANIAARNEELVDAVAVAAAGFGRIKHKINCLQRLVITDEAAETIARDALDIFKNSAGDDFQKAWADALPILTEIAARRAATPAIPAAVARLEAEASALREDILAECKVNGVNPHKVISLLHHQARNSKSGRHDRFDDWGRICGHMWGICENSAAVSPAAGITQSDCPPAAAS